MRARIKEKREVAKGTLFVVFDLLGAEVDFCPGQYFWVTLLDPPHDDEKGARRHISVATSPTERGVIGFCTRLRDSAFKRSLAELPVGAEVEVEPPKGTFVLPEDASRPLVFVAGGIGITAFRSMLRYIQDKGLSHRVTLSVDAASYHVGDPISVTLSNHSAQTISFINLKSECSVIQLQRQEDGNWKEVSPCPKGRDPLSFHLDAGKDLTVKLVSSSGSAGLYRAILSYSTSGVTEPLVVSSQEFQVIANPEGH